MTDFEMLLDKTKEMCGKIYFIDFNEYYSLCVCCIKDVRLYWIFDTNNKRVFASVNKDKAYVTYIIMSNNRR